MNSNEAEQAYPIRNGDHGTWPMAPEPFGIEAVGRPITDRRVDSDQSLAPDPLPASASRGRTSLLARLAVFAAIITAPLWLGRIADPARAGLALALVLVLPGFALLTAFLPGGTIGGPARLALSLGLSVAVTALVGLILDVTPWGLSTRPWAISLGTIFAVAGAIGWKRRRPRRRSNDVRSTLSLRYGALFGLAALMTVGAIGAARLGAARQPSPGFTQLWLVPEAGNPGIVHLGIHSEEKASVSYQIELTSGTVTIGTWSPIKLAPGATWQTTVFLPPHSVAGNGNVEAKLYRLAEPASVYRWVVLRGGG